MDKKERRFQNIRRILSEGKARKWIAELLIISLLLPSLSLAGTLRLSPDSGTYDVVFTGLEDGDTGESVEIIATPAPQFEEEEEEECSFWFIGCESDYTVEWDIDDPSGTFEEIEFKFEGETEYTSEELSGEETIVEEEEESSGTVTATIYHEYGELTIED